MRLGVFTTLLLAGLAGCSETTDIIGSRIPASTSGEPDASLPDASIPDATPDAVVDAEPDAMADADVVDPDDVLTEIGFPQEDSQQRIADAFEQLFFGDPDDEAIYREPEADAAYVEDVKNNDVRTDAIGYGMFIAVQVDRQDVFDKIWTWAKRYMLGTEPPRQGLLAWRCETDGTACDTVAATDATSMIATSLFIAEARWSTGAHDYADDANMLLDAMVLTEERNGGTGDGVQNLFDVDAMLPRRWSYAGENQYLQTDYLMPAFYDYWSKWRTEDAEFWSGAAAASRQVLQAAAVPENGLIPLEVDADGVASPETDFYDEVSARALLNRWFVNSWMGSSAWVTDQSVTLLDFFLAQQDPLVSSYYLDGGIRGDINTVAHIALSATAAAVSGDLETYGVFLQTLVDTPIPTGTDRYYDGTLYLIAFLAVSGNIEAGEP